MSKLNGQWIEAFRAGDYGEKGSYDRAAIDQMVASYNPAHHEAPVVLGHPEKDAPAYGWVEAVKREGDVLFAKLKQVSPQLEQLVQDGSFKKRSVAFYKKPDGLSLRHLGFLGAMPPEVKGLADIKLCEFRDGEFQAIEFKEEEMDKDDVKKTFMEGLKEFFSSWKPQPEPIAAKTFGEDDVKRIATEAVTAATAPLTTEITKLRTELSEQKDKSKTVAIVGLAEGAIAKLKAEKKYINAFDKMGVPQIFAELAKSEVKVTFGEGDKKVEKPMVEVFADFFRGIGEIVPSAEIAKGAAKAGKVLNFNEGRGIGLDEGSVQMKEAASKRATEKKITFGEALKQLRSEGFTPSVEGGATSNAV
jgi:hypothetical protein